MGRTCVFCFKDEGRTDPWVPGNPGEGCTFGMRHDYGDNLAPVKAAAPSPQVKKPSKNLCTKCGLHPNNPASSTNGCAHEYPTV